ncbi:hypothetical protein AKJ16_DCAP00044 [Drosera capensis]
MKRQGLDWDVNAGIMLLANCLAIQAPSSSPDGISEFRYYSIIVTWASENHQELGFVAESFSWPNIAYLHQMNPLSRLHLDDVIS